MGEGFFSGFPSYKDQSALSFLKGRSSRFFTSTLFVQSCRGKKFSCILRVFGSGLFSFGFIRLLEFLIYLVITVNAVFLVVKIFLFFSFVPCYFCKWCVFYALLSCLLFVYFGCAGSVGVFWRAGSYTFSVCDSAMWSAGPVQFYLGFLLERMAGLYRFLYVWLCCIGYGTVEMVGGVVRLFVLSLVCCQFSWRLDVCGRILVLYILIFIGKFVVFSCGFVF